MDGFMDINPYIFQLGSPKKLKNSQAPNYYN